MRNLIVPPLAAIGMAALPCLAVAQTAPRPSDVASPEAIVQASFESTDRGPGEPFDWDRYLSLRLPGALVIPNAEQTGGALSPRPAEEFVRVVDAWYAENAAIDDPDDRGFTERGVHEVHHRYGDVAQVISTYEKRFADSDDVLARGVMFTTVVFDGTRWWIVSTATDEEYAAGAIPAEYLP